MASEHRDDRPPEMPAARTTIVGGRPPGPGTSVGPIPFGIEILIKKAAVDPEFKALLLEKRAAAAAEIEGLVLEEAEASMLNSVPAGQLEAIIAATKVPEDTRRGLLGKVTLTALAALGIVALVPMCIPTLGISPDRLPTKGISPDRPPAEDGTTPAVSSSEDAPKNEHPPAGTQPGSTGMRPDLPVSRGIRPDRPGRGSTE